MRHVTSSRGVASRESRSRASVPTLRRVTLSVADARRTATRRRRPSTQTRRWAPTLHLLSVSSKRSHVAAAPPRAPFSPLLLSSHPQAGTR